MIETPSAVKSTPILSDSFSGPLSSHVMISQNNKITTESLGTVSSENSYDNGLNKPNNHFVMMAVVGKYAFMLMLLALACLIGYGFKRRQSSVKDKVSIEMPSIV